MYAVYNEFDPFAAAWLQNLSAAGHIARGAVDARPIQCLSAAEASAAPQFHAFAGLGAWSYALQLAGWPDDRPVWTGSCPCQPFSSAGKGEGVEDERHLWPEFFRLIAECRPPVVFGEQVAGDAGRAWLDLVRADLEGAGYAFGAADLCAAGVGAPHIRQRLYFGAVRVGDADGDGVGKHGRIHVVCEGEHEVRTSALRHTASASGPDRRVADAMRDGRQQDGRYLTGGPVANGARAADRNCDGGALDPWAPLEWLPCRDGKTRPTQPGLFPLAHGAPARVGRLRAYGNAIVPQVAAAFIRAFMDDASETE